MTCLKCTLASLMAAAVAAKSPITPDSKESNRICMPHKSTLYFVSVADRLFRFHLTVLAFIIFIVICVVAAAVFDVVVLSIANKQTWFQFDHDALFSFLSFSSLG